eukprot:g38251.t1
MHARNCGVPAVWKEVPVPSMCYTVVNSLANAFFRQKRNSSAECPAVDIASNCTSEESIGFSHDLETMLPDHMASH